MHYRIAFSIGLAGLLLLPAVLAEFPRDLARIDTDVSPDRAQLFVDGAYVGIADDFDGRPDYLYLEPGRHTLEFKANEYQGLRILLEVRAGDEKNLRDRLRELEDLEEDEPRVLELNMIRKPAGKTPPAPPPPEEPKSRISYIIFLVEPEDAAIWIDHSFVGVVRQFNGNPTRAVVGAGKHQVELTRPGFQPYRMSVEVKPEETHKLRLEMLPEEKGGR